MTTIPFSTLFDTAQTLVERQAAIVGAQMAAEELGEFDIHDRLDDLRETSFAAAAAALGITSAAKMRDYYVIALDRVPVTGLDMTEAEVDALIEILVDVLDVDFEDEDDVSVPTTDDATV